MFRLKSGSNPAIWRPSIEPIRLIQDIAQLNGTCYFELHPGPLRLKNWNADSAFIAEEVFSLLELIMFRHVPEFSHYGPLEIRRPIWEKVIADLHRLEQFVRNARGVGDLRDEVYFLHERWKEEFTRDFSKNAEALARLSRDLADWLGQQLKSHECISVIGI